MSSGSAAVDIPMEEQFVTRSCPLTEFLRSLLAFFKSPTPQLPIPEPPPTLAELISRNYKLNKRSFNKIPQHATFFLALLLGLVSLHSIARKDGFPYKIHRVLFDVLFFPITGAIVANLLIMVPHANSKLAMLLGQIKIICIWLTIICLLVLVYCSLFF